MPSTFFYSLLVLICFFTPPFVLCRQIPAAIIDLDEEDNELDFQIQEDSQDPPTDGQCPLANSCKDNYLLFVDGLPPVDSCIKSIPQQFTTVSIHLKKSSWFESLASCGGSSERSFDLKEVNIYTQINTQMNLEKCSSGMQIHFNVYFVNTEFNSWMKSWNEFQSIPEDVWTGFHVLPHLSNGNNNVEVLSVNEPSGYLQSNDAAAILKGKQLTRTPKNNQNPSCMVRRGVDGLDAELCDKKFYAFCKNTYREARC